MHNFHKVREMKGGVYSIWRLVHKGDELYGHDQKIENNNVRLQHHVVNLNTNHIMIRTISFCMLLWKLAMKNKVYCKHQMCSTAKQRKILNLVVIHQSNRAFEAQPHASWVSHLQLSKNHFYRFANWTLHCWANFLLSSLACQGYWCQHDIASTLWSNKGFFHLKCWRQQVCAIMVGRHFSHFLWLHFASFLFLVCGATSLQL